MNKTNDFKYNLPAYSDPVDIEDLNDNFRGIDDALMAGLCKKDYTGNNMGSSDPSARKYAWAPWLEIVNDNEFDVVVTDRNAPVESEEATINIAAGQTFRKYINGRYYMNFYVQDQHDVTFKWFTNAETYINESGGGGGGTGTVTSVSVQGGSGSHLTASGNPIETSGTITINVDDGYSIPSDDEQTAWDGKAADLKAEIDSSTYVLTLQLKDSSGNLIGNERTIDLPLETMVVDGEYDPQTQKIKLELKNGNYVEFSVADLVSGLQTELSASNKLDPDYIDYDSSHRAVSDTEKNTWSAKQNAISDLETIRSGAAAGATAVQPSAMEDALDTKQDSLDSTQLAAVNSGINSTKVDQISTNQTNILYVSDNIGKNIVNILDGTYTRSAIANCIAKAGNYVVSAESITSTDTDSSDCRIVLALKGDQRGTGYIGRGSNKYVTITATTEFDEIVIYASDNYVHSENDTLTVSRMMLCTEEAWNISHAYEPYALPNYDLTRLEAEDRAALAEVVDSGAKNVARENNITYTGTNTVPAAECYCDSITGSIHVHIDKIQSTDTDSTLCYYRIIYNDDTYNEGNFNRDIVIDIDIYTNKVVKKIAIYPSSNAPKSIGDTVTITNIMVCTKAAFGVSNKFVPFGNDPFYQVPINHNMIYRGRNLGATLTDAQHTALSSGNFTDLYLGDYWTKTVTIPAGTYTGGDGEEVTVPAQTNITLKAVIADFDTFYAGYASSYAGINTHHAAVIVTGFSNVVWNKTNSTAGGYVASLIHKWLVGSALPQIETWFGSAKVLSHQKLLTNAITGDAASGWAWSSQKISLLSENQMYGSKVWGGSKATNGGYEPGEAFKHLNVFNHIDANLLFSNKNIWLRNIASAVGAADLCNIGYARHSATSIAEVAPAALILLS